MSEQCGVARVYSDEWSVSLLGGSVSLAAVFVSMACPWVVLPLYGMSGLILLLLYSRLSVL